MNSISYCVRKLGQMVRATKLVFFLFFAFTVDANTITVLNNNDSGTGSLRDAIALANNEDTIKFDPSLLGDTIRLTSGEIIISINLSIIGLGDDTTIISGNDSSRIFKISAGDTVNIERLSLTKGMAVDSGGAIYNNGILSLKFCSLNNNTSKFGGALYNNDQLTVATSNISDNFASTGQGGGIYSSRGTLTASLTTFENNTSVSGGGAIASLGSCSLDNVTITGNFSNTGGGIYSENTLIVLNSDISFNNANFGDGGGILNFGNGRFIQCTIENNHVNNAGFSGGGVYTNSNSFQLLLCRVSGNLSNGGSGGIHNGDSLTIITSTISNNSASLLGGGIGNYGLLNISNSTVSGNESGDSGGGILNNGNLTINNSTVSENKSGNSGGGIDNDGKTTLSRCTVAFNKALSNGGGVNNSDSLFFLNTIIANDTANGQGDELFNVSGKIISLGHNLVRDITPLGPSDIAPGAGDILGTSSSPRDPLLGPLQNNGGTTLTHEPFCGSPAIDAGDPAGALSTDQRDSARIHGSGIDIGSVESQADPIELDAAIVNVFPAGNNNGSIELLISGGVPPYYINWNNGDSVNTISGLTAGNYTVTVEDFYGCSASGVFEVDEPTGIHGGERSAIAVYPNPASEFLFIENTDFFYASVLDLLGKEMKKIDSNVLDGIPLSISLNELPPGNYLLLIYENSGKIYERSRFTVMR